MELNEKIRDLNLKILSVEQVYETTRRQCHTLQRNLQSVTEDREDLKNRLNVFIPPEDLSWKRNFFILLFRCLPRRTNI